ncbi:hypothetical protein [Methanothrix soehngenii]
MENDENDAKVEWGLEVEELVFTGCMSNHTVMPGLPFRLWIIRPEDECID